MKSTIIIIVSIVVALASVLGGVLATVTSVDIKGISNDIAQAAESAKASAKYSFELNKGAGGTVDGDSGVFAGGTVLNLKATPSEGHIFMGWYSNRGMVISDELTYSFEIHKNTFIEARFAETAKQNSLTDVFSSSIETMVNNYTESTAKIVEDVVSAINVENVAVKEVAQEYLENLNAAIAEIVESSGGDEEAVKQFAQNEAEALDATVSIINSVTSSSTSGGASLPSSSSLENAAEKVSNSPLTQEMVLSAANNTQLSSSAQEQFNKLEPEAKEEYKEAVQSMKNNPNISPEIANALQAFFGIH